MSIDDKIYRATAVAISRARQENRAEVTGDDLLVGLLVSISQFGVVALGKWLIDLDDLGVDWMEPATRATSGPKYSTAAARIFEKGAAVARSEQKPTSVTHLLVAFEDIEDGLMGMLKKRYGFDRTGWRAALAEYSSRQNSNLKQDANEGNKEKNQKELYRKELLSPEEAAELLGVHIQTLRGYIRSGKLPAFRVAGERAIRIRREDLIALLEPLVPGEES